jgi:hypothetical protein
MAVPLRLSIFFHHGSRISVPPHAAQARAFPSAHQEWTPTIARVFLLLRVQSSRAQQTAMPVVGYLSIGSPESDAVRLTGLRHGLNEALALLHELVSKVPAIGFLQNPTNPINDFTTRDVLAAVSAIGIKVQVLKASTDREIDAAFASLVQAQTGALLVSNDVFFNNSIEQIVALAARHAIPVMCASP